MNEKPPLQSKTIIINGLLLVAALATLFSGADLGLPPEVAHYASIALAVANVVNLWLRTITTSAIAGTPAAKDARRKRALGRHGTRIE